jgi:hypothetical protein
MVVDLPPPVVPRMAVWRGRTDFSSDGMPNEAAPQTDKIYGEVIVIH